VAAEVIDEDGGFVVGLSRDDAKMWKEEAVKDVQREEATGVCVGSGLEDRAIRRIILLASA